VQMRRVPTAPRVAWDVIPTEFHPIHEPMMRIAAKTRLVEPDWWY
jgi:hypothetical protein